MHDPRKSARVRIPGPLAAAALWILIIAIAAGPVSAGADDASPATDFRVGAARVDITPDRPLIMAGYGVYAISRSLCRWSEGVHDPIYATAFFVLSGPDPLLIVSLDVVGLVSPDVNAIRTGIADRTGVPVDRIVAASTHTHSAPDTMGIWGTMLPPSSGRDEAYMQELRARAVDAGARAVESARPARLYYAIGELTGLQKNIKEDYAENTSLDPTIVVLRAVDTEGKVVATLTNWGCHPTAEKEKGRMISADWVGAYYQRMLAADEGVPVFVNGSIGAAIQPSPVWLEENLHGDGQGFVWADAIGRRVAEKVLGMTKEMTEIRAHSIPAESRTIGTPMKNWIYSFTGHMGLMPFEVPKRGEPMETTITAARIGPLRVGTIPGEISPHLGDRIRKAMGGDAQILVGLGQDALGYIIDTQQYEDDDYSYERMLCVGPEFGDAIIEGHRRIAADLAGASSGDASKTAAR